MPVRGRPFEPGNTFGRGRPRGSRNKKSLQIEELVSSYSEPLVRKAMVEALKGDNVLLAKLLNQFVPARREAPVKMGSLPVETAADLARSSGKVLKKVTTGDLSIKEGQGMVDLLTRRAEFLFMESVEKRLAALENETRQNQQ